MTGARPRRGLISGHVLRAIRESVPATQDVTAERLGLDRHTVQGWESGRRPFTAVATAAALRYRYAMIALGAAPALLDILADAAEADHVLDVLLCGDGPTTTHPLAQTVLPRSVVGLLDWSLTGAPPALLAGFASRPRPGPASAGPTLTVAERQAVAESLHAAVDWTERADDERSLLLHRQAIYHLTSLQRGVDVLRSPPRHRRLHGRSPRWSDTRTVVIARAVAGDSAPLLAFLEESMSTDACEAANLNYWAYYAGEIPGRWVCDRPQVDPGVVWRGTRLLRHLTAGLDPARPYLALTVRSVWSLLAARRGVARNDPAVGRMLARRVLLLLDAADLPTRTRSELASISYALRADEVHP